MPINPPLCPVHNIPMVLKTARFGKFAGNKFFGCPKHPKCRELINYDPALHGLDDNKDLNHKFTIGKEYTRSDIFDILGISPHPTGGNWFTGYARHNGDFYIFTNVESPGRTGHDYGNKWIDSNLHWCAKTNTNIHQPLMQDLISADSDVHVFWRRNNSKPFFYAGLAKLVDYKNTSPVEILWSFPKSSKAIKNIKISDGKPELHQDNPKVDSNKSSLENTHTPLRVLNLSVRSYNALRRGGVEYCEQLERLSVDQIASIRGIGDMSLNEIRIAIKRGYKQYHSSSEIEVYKDSNEKHSETEKELEDNPNLIGAIDHALRNLDLRDRDILKLRFGLDGGKKHTIIEIGERYGLSQNRIRQLISRALHTIRTSKISYKLRDFIVCNITDKDEFLTILGVEDNFNNHTLLNHFMLLNSVFRQKPEILLENDEIVYVIPNEFIDLINETSDTIEGILSEDGRPRALTTIVHILKDKGNQDKNAIDIEKLVSAAVQNSSHLEKKGMPEFVSLSNQNRRGIVDGIIRALNIIGEPTHYSRITEVLNSSADIAPISKRNLYAKLNYYSEYFVRVGHGVFGLKEWGLPDDGNLANAAARVLKEAGRNLHIDEITNRVLETWVVKPTSVLIAMKDDARFIELQPDIYILREQIDRATSSFSKNETADKRYRELPSAQGSTVKESLDPFVMALKEMKSGTNRVEPNTSKVEVFGPIEIDNDERRIYIDDKQRKLRRKTYELLIFLLSNQGRLISYDEIIKNVWRRGGKDDKELVDSHIRRLWEIIEDDIQNPKIIRKRRDEGYLCQVR